MDLSNLEYADGVVQLKEDSSKLRVFLGHTKIFGMSFTFEIWNAFLRMGWIKTQILFLEKNNRVKWTELVSWVVESHLLVGHRMKCFWAHGSIKEGNKRRALVFERRRHCSILKILLRMFVSNLEVGRKVLRHSVQLLK